MNPCMCEVRVVYGEIQSTEDIEQLEYYMLGNDTKNMR